jgi:hypothetical protein
MKARTFIAAAVLAFATAGANAQNITEDHGAISGGAVQEHHWQKPIKEPDPDPRIFAVTPLTSGAALGIAMAGSSALYLELGQVSGTNAKCYWTDGNKTFTLTDAAAGVTNSGNAFVRWIKPPVAIQSVGDANATQD